jgi:hypothetical protein
MSRSQKTVSGSFSAVVAEKGPDTFNSRRRFLGGVVGILGIGLAGRWFVPGAVQAEAVGVYPGRVVALAHVDNQARWKG